MSMRAAAQRPSNASQPTSPAVLSGSPFTYQNNTNADVDVTVQGGSVTTISYSRDGTNWTMVGLLAGMFRLSPSDYLRIAYLTTPTVTVIPR